MSVSPPGGARFRRITLFATCLCILCFLVSANRVRFTHMPSGKVAVVTGAGSGIGRAVSLALYRIGYSVVVAGRRVAELEKTAAQASGSGTRMFAVQTDVSKPDQVRALFARTKEEFGRLDLLFNNAGIGGPAVPIEELRYEDWMA